jgi:nucleoside-diphosphate-sugar epimerase
MKPKSILVIGATGYIGRQVCAALAASDWAQPIAGVRDPLRAPQGIGARRLDLADAATLAPALDGVAGVVNCASGGADVLADGAQRLYAAAAACASPPHIVHLSTQSVYGAATGTVDESAPLRADLGEYSQSKLTAERAGEAYAARTVLRPGIVFGPHSPQWSTRIAQLLKSGRLGELGPAGEGCCNLVHVADVAAAAERALASALAASGPPAARCYNLALPEPPTWNAFFAAYARALGLPGLARAGATRLWLDSRLLTLPLKVLERVGARLGVPAASLPPALPPSLLGLFAQPLRLDSHRARDELGLVFRPLEAMVAEAAATGLT